MRKFLLSFSGIMIALSTCAFAQEGDAVAGKKVFKKCAACHNAEEPQKKVGPHLVGIIDRPMVSVEDYKYSKAMVAFADGDKVWSEELLRDYLIAPRALVKGTKMAFVGVRKPEDMENLMTYLKSLEAE